MAIREEKIDLSGMTLVVDGLEVGGVDLAAELAVLGGVTSSAAELNFVDGSVAGTAVASKALVLGADKNVDTLVIADGGLKLGAGAGTAVGATAAELNVMDVSAQTETIAEGGVVSVTKRFTKLTQAGAGAITLAAPDGTMLGQVKVIEQVAGTTDNVTLALTNVDGGSAATTATFNAAGETLIMVAGNTKWHVVKEIGVTLS